MEAGDRGEVFASFFREERADVENVLSHCSCRGISGIAAFAVPISVGEVESVVIVCVVSVHGS